MLHQNGCLPSARYWGTVANEDAEDNAIPTIPNNQASVLLARLNERARARKAGKVGLESRFTSGEDNTTCSSVKGNENDSEENHKQSPTKKKKKSKKKDQTSAVATDAEETTVNGEMNGEDSPPKKKKKKKHAKEVEEDIGIEASHKKEEVEPNDDHPSKKGKKHKLRTNSLNLEAEEVGCNQADDIGNKKSSKKLNKGQADTSKATFVDDITQRSVVAPTETSVGESSEKKRKRKMGDKPESEDDSQNAADGGEQSTMLSANKKKKKKVTEPSKNNDLNNVSHENQEKHAMENGVVANDDTFPNEDDFEQPETSKLKTKIREKRRQKKDKKQAEKKQARRNGEIGGFTMMGEVSSTSKAKVERVLPHWMANPIKFGRDIHGEKVNVESIPGIDASLKKVLEEQKIKYFFPVQKCVIPELLASASSISTRFRPRDICVSAPTGSGKTLGFVLPIIQALSTRNVPRIRALVLLPVQELALQVFKVFQIYAAAKHLKVGLANGGKLFKEEQKSLVRHDYAGYHSLIDILVATPGRLADHLSFTKGFDLSYLRYLVLDEADHMLATNGGEWINRIEQSIKDHSTSVNGIIGGLQGKGALQFPKLPLHRLLFSATLTNNPEQLKLVPLYRPKLFTTADGVNVNLGMKNSEMRTYTRPAELREEFTVVEESVKPLVVHHLIRSRGWSKVLIFTNSLETTHKLTVLLSFMAGGLNVSEFSSSIDRKRRKHIVTQFLSGEINVLIASDVMARGLDIPNVDNVVCYDVTSITTYIHRIGRTARAGTPGTAVSLVTLDKMRDFKAVIANGGQDASEFSVPTEELEPYEEMYVEALAKMKDSLHGEQQKEREKIERENAHKHRRHGERNNTQGDKDTVSKRLNYNRNNRN